MNALVACTVLGDVINNYYISFPELTLVPVPPWFQSDGSSNKSTIKTCACPSGVLDNPFALSPLHPT
jgi:hypothetical protein